MYADALLPTTPSDNLELSALTPADGLDQRLMHEFLGLLEMMQEEHEQWKSISSSPLLPQVPPTTTTTASTADYLIASPPEASLALCWRSPEETTRRDCDTDPERDDNDDHCELDGHPRFVAGLWRNNKRTRHATISTTEEEDMTETKGDVELEDEFEGLPARRRKRSRPASPADEDSPGRRKHSRNPTPR